MTGAFSTLLRQSGMWASTGGVLETKSERKMLASTRLYSLYAWFVSVLVCQFVSRPMFVRTITSERLHVGRSNLAVRYVVQKFRPSSKVKVKGQSSSTKIEKLLIRVIPIDNAYRARPYAARRRYHCVPPGGDGLRRWQNQRMLSSF